MSHHVAHEEKPVLSFGAGVAFALLIVALVLIAINYVKVVTSHDAHHGPAPVEAHGGNHHGGSVEQVGADHPTVDHSQVTNTAPVPNADTNQTAEEAAPATEEHAH